VGYWKNNEKDKVDNKMKERICALVLGGYVNGYSIIQELYECGVPNIILFDYSKNLTAYSNKIKAFYYIDKNSNSLKIQLLKLHEDYDYIVAFPTDDLHVEMICEIYDDVSSFCFLPVHKENSIRYQNKYEQYIACEKLGVPYPKTVNIEKINDLCKLEAFLWPALLKPTSRKDLTTAVFRSLILQNKQDLDRHMNKLNSFINEGIGFLASEIIPGDGSKIYAYVGYRNKEGKILNEWTGKKLSQFPNDFGVFSSASNEAPLEVLEQGRILLNGMDLYGINEPEFKYDYRDNKYKLMEINLRSMMWHRIGNRSGVHIQYTQWLDALGEPVPKQVQEKNKRIHYVYYKHELINLLTRRGYLRIFKHNLWEADETSFAVFDKKDIRPFVHDILPTMKGLGGQWLRILKLR